MKATEFVELLKNTLEINAGNFSEETNLKDRKEYDSMAVLSITALTDRKFGVKLTGDQFKNVTTVRSLMNLIGTEKFS